MSSTISTLEEVANQFQVWRDNKKNSKFSPIPTHLKNICILEDNNLLSQQTTVLIISHV